MLIKQVNPSLGEKLIYGEETTGLTFLILFKEGFRIDFGFSPIRSLKDEIDDSLSYVLVDKDQIIPKLPEPSDASYWVKKPLEAEYDFVANEFWWCLTNIAKGIFRDELPYVQGMYEMVVRKPLMKMIEWYLGSEHEWKVNTGKFGKWFKRYLREDLYALLCKSYSGRDYEQIWNSLFSASSLFRHTAQEVAKHLSYIYSVEDDHNVVEYLKQVRGICL